MWLDQGFKIIIIKELDSILMTICYFFKKKKGGKKPPHLL